ncbi:MAG: nucleotidyltransferase family protein [Clostridia bacterium]|nr:nucleotidyltransferase family protein [Clostridia bacterium]
MIFDAVFIVCEFDPMHKGHEYLIQKAKEISKNAPVICIMSGNFTQRGECSVLGKYERAKCAVLCSADLVISLPTVYSCACAEVFAKGAVQIAANFAQGKKCALLFGSESGDIDELSLCAERLSSERFKNALSKLPHGLPYASELSKAYEDIYGSCDVLSKPNNILGIEYIKAINEYAPFITAMTVKRIGSDHNALTSSDTFVSGSYLRKIAKDDEFFSHIPKQTEEIYRTVSSKGQFPSRMENGERVILHLLRQSAKGPYAECGGGLYERIVSCAKKATSYEELVAISQTKRYTNARIRRAIIYICLGITEEMMSKKPSFTQLLAANTNGTAILADIRKRQSITIITKPADHIDKPDFQSELKADELYAFMTPDTMPYNMYLTKTPFILKDVR